MVGAIIKAMDEPLTQKDLDTLFEDIAAETKKPREVKEVKSAESLNGSEFLSQDQIDELLKAFQND